MVTTANFPQADHLMQVGLVAFAVAQRKTTDDEIEKFIGLDSAGRQGRYYRLAAEILGLIKNQDNHAELTTLGQEFTTLHSEAAKKEFLAQCLIETPVFQATLHYIQQHQPDDRRLKLWFRSFYPGAQSTADRRFSTLLHYFRDADLLEYRGNRITLKKFSSAFTVSRNRIYSRNESKISLKEGKNITTQSIIHMEVEAQKLEQANHTHWKLVDAKAQFLDSRSWSPSVNLYIDLYTQAEDEFIIYEMKSVDAHGNNLLAQIRKAVSQLYEYRYLCEEPNARLCMVTNHRISKKNQWLLDYLAKDRAIAYEWTEDFVHFECATNSASLLGRFSPR